MFGPFLYTDSQFNISSIVSYLAKLLFKIEVLRPVATENLMLILPKILNLNG